MVIHVKNLKYEVISEPIHGEIENGDQYLVKECPNNVLIAVVDGLGHGKEAAFAAKKAIQILDANAETPILKLFQLCNNELKDTRGVAMTIVNLDLNYKLSYIAVGNVSGVCWILDDFSKLKSHSIFLEGGIIGARLPVLMEEKDIKMSRGDTLILATDGIKIQYENEPPKLATPNKIAEEIFQRYRNKNDDGLILVAQLT